MKGLTEKEKLESKQFLYEVLKIPTVNPPGKEAVLAKYLARYGAEYGLMSDVLLETSERANVRISLPGRKKEVRLILNGHLDTVPVGDVSKWNTNPYVPEEIDGRVYCRGASDMKGGLCAMIYAMQLLKAENFIPEETIHFYGTFDEESDGLGASQIAEEIAAEKDAVLYISEPTGNTISIASKGAIWLEVSSAGKTAHGAYSDEGINAIESLIDFVTELKKLLPPGKNLFLGENTCQLTTMKGGIKTNVIPDSAEANLDIRLIPETDSAQFLRDLEKLQEKFNSIHKGKITVKIINHRESVSVDKVDDGVLLLQKAHENAFGEEALFSGTNFFSDASIIQKNRKIPTVLYGPGEMREAHIPNESLELEKYYQAIRTYYELMKNYKRWEENI